MKRRHDMPFGATIDGDGTVFRLWAPAAGRVELCIAGDPAREMAPAGDGFFEMRVAGAGAGTRYGFRIDGGDPAVPDPASRYNPEDVHAFSEVIDPQAFDWQDKDWKGRPWNEAVIYELHPGSFNSPAGFDGIRSRLEYLAGLGVTAIELMPVADFPGHRGWGYDGVLLFAPEAGYGRPDDFKAMVQAAHELELMVILDVVYNHFGPDGNYLHMYAPQFFTDRIETPWGQAMNFDGEYSATVRDFFIHNALYWLEEFNLDGLRIDAVHAIHDRSSPDVLEELADRVRHQLPADRRIHLILENDGNHAHYLRPEEGGGQARFDAQWNDDFHHAMHLLLTGESQGYYADYSDDTIDRLGRCLAEGFAYQGEYSPYRDRPRGEPSGDLPSSAFVNFLQNHDMVGNRALGERLVELAAPEALAAAEAILMLAPQPPMLFMGEEFAASSRFPYFCDYSGELAKAVSEGRRREFSRFPQFSDPAMLKRIPDPNDPATFEKAKLDWQEPDQAGHRETRDRYRQLLKLRHELLIPRLPASRGEYRQPQDRVLAVSWALNGGGRWHMLAQLDGPETTVSAPAGRPVFALGTRPDGQALTLSAWTVAVFLED